MLRETALDQLRRHYLFATFSDPEFERIAAQTAVQRRSDGGLLFQRGEPASQFFVVLEGDVRLYVQSRDGAEAVIQLARPGQGFAEAVMFMQMPVYPVSAQALGPSVVAAVGNEAYREVLRQNPTACLRLLGDLSARLHGLVGEIESLTLETARVRLLRHLLALAGPDATGPTTVRLPEAKQLLAARLAIKPETLSRTLRTLAADGLIAVDGPEIRIGDIGRLRTRA